MESELTGLEIADKILASELPIFEIMHGLPEDGPGTPSTHIRIYYNGRVDGLPPGRKGIINYYLAMHVTELARISQLQKKLNEIDPPMPEARPGFVYVENTRREKWMLRVKCDVEGCSNPMRAGNHNSKKCDVHLDTFSVGFEPSESTPFVGNIVGHVTVQEENESVNFREDCLESIANYYEQLPKLKENMGSALGSVLIWTALLGVLISGVCNVSTVPHLLKVFSPDAAEREVGRLPKIVILHNGNQKEVEFSLVGKLHPLGLTSIFYIYEKLSRIMSDYHASGSGAKPGGITIIESMVWSWGGINHKAIPKDDIGFGSSIISNHHFKLHFGVFDLDWINCAANYWSQRFLGYQTTLSSRLRSNSGSASLTLRSVSLRLGRFHDLLVLLDHLLRNVRLSGRSPCLGFGGLSGRSSRSGLVAGDLNQLFVLPDNLTSGLALLASGQILKRSSYSKAQSSERHESSRDDHRLIGYGSLSPPLKIVHVLTAILAIIGSFFSCFFMVLNLVFAPRWFLLKAACCLVCALAFVVLFFLML